MKVIIIEDEQPSADHLSFLLKKIDPTAEMVACIDTVKSAVEQFNSGLTGDLVFMDIHLADGNSFDIFKHANLDLPVIFTTAYNQYAIQAFTQNSIGYLLKPISLPELTAAIAKFKKQNTALDKRFIEHMLLAKSTPQRQYKSRFMVKAGQHIRHIEVTEVAQFEANDSLTCLVTRSGDKYAIDYSLEQLEDMLLPQDFFRINRATLVHIRSIESVVPYFNSRLAIHARYLQGDARIVSRERVADFKKWLDS